MHPHWLYSALWLMIWVALGAIAAVATFIYPLTLTICPLQCTVESGGNNCYLHFPEHPFYGKEPVNCSYVGTWIDCYRYTDDWKPTEINMRLTTSRWEAQYGTAYYNIWYVVSSAIAIALFIGYTFCGFVALLTIGVAIVPQIISKRTSLEEASLKRTSLEEASLKKAGLKEPYPKNPDREVV